MFADKGPLFIYVGLPLKKQPFPATISIYYISSVYTVFLIKKMTSFILKATHFSKQIASALFYWYQTDILHRSTQAI